MALIDDQLRTLQDTYSSAICLPLPDGSSLVTVPEVKLPSGWSSPQATVKFLLPVGFPHAQPDCFWIEPHIRLASGAMPQRSNVQVIPGTTDNWVWFSWHATKWRANDDTISTYMKIIEARLREAR